MTAPPSRLTAALADRYTLERELGQGGMATVYLAEDLKHKRKVALKVLRPELAAVLGAERFVQEITTTANLQHPHILPLFDSGTAGQKDGGTAFLYYVMPYVEGETLRQKLDREKQLSIEDAVRITTDVASALHYAHEHGVIHRDIKPENILLHDGRPMVADFGIALAVSAAAGGRMTETGLSLGTPHYMSPEQATAEKDLTGRSDVYSLGAVLYEMLSGEPPHMGNTAQQIVMKIVTDDARPVAELRRSVPPHVAAAVAKSLEKLPADRFATASAFADALHDPSLAPTLTSTTVGGRPSTIGVSTLAAAFALGAALVWLVKPSAESLVRYDVGLPADAPMVMHDWSRALDIASDGSFIVYRAGTEDAPYLRYQSLQDTASYAIPGTEGGTGPAISPDGSTIAFVTLEEFKTVGVAGGAVRSLTAVENAISVDWVSPTRILLNDLDGQSFRWFDVDTDREQAEIVLCHFPQPLLDDRVLCGGGGSNYAKVLHADRSDEQFLRIGDAGAGDSAAYLRGTDFRLVDDAYLVFISIDGNLRAAPFDPQSLVTGRPVTLIQGVRRQAYSGAGQFALDADGTLVYATGVNGDLGRLVSWSPGGQPMPILDDPEVFLRWEMAPDGRQLAAVVSRPNFEELRLYDLTTGQWEAWLRAGVINEPMWLDANRLLVSNTDVEATNWAMMVGSPSALTPPDTMLSGEGWGWAPFTKTASGIILVNKWGREIQLARIDLASPTPSIEPLIDEAFFPALSPDERWLAFNSGAAIYIAPYPSLASRIQIARDGSEPHWLSNTELVYWRQGGTFWRAEIDPTSGALRGSPDLWYQDGRFSDTPGHSISLSANGALLYVQEPEQPPAPYLRVIPNWVDQMKAAVDEAN